MPQPRRAGGTPDLLPREGAGHMLMPEVKVGARGAYMPTGTRERASDVPLRYEPTRNGLPPFVGYDESEAARRARRMDPSYRHARLALERAQARFGPRPQTIRGLSKDAPAAGT